MQQSTQPAGSLRTDREKCLARTVSQKCGAKEDRKRRPGGVPSAPSQERRRKRLRNSLALRAPPIAASTSLAGIHREAGPPSRADTKSRIQTRCTGAGSSRRANHADERTFCLPTLAVAGRGRREVEITGTSSGWA